MPRYQDSYNYEPEMRRGRRTMNRTRVSNHYDDYPYLEPMYRGDYRDDYVDMTYRNEYRNAYPSNMQHHHSKMGFGKSEEYMLSDKEMKMWVHEMETTDNNGAVVKRGEKYTEQQAMDMAKRLNIKFDKFSEKSFWVALNMMFSDYYSVLGENPDIYARLAKAWLCDSDVAMTGDDKLYAYYCYVVDGEEY